jgi:Fe-S-cluster containining protein
MSEAPAARSAPADDMAGRAMEAATQALSAGRLPRDVAAMSLAHASQEQERVVEAEKIPPPACGVNCTFCCSIRVSMTPAEADLLAAYFTETLDAAGLAGLKARVSEAAAKRAAGVARVPCPLLSDGACSAYPVRPFACRAWHSYSRDDCEADERDPRGVAITYNPFLLGAAQSVRVGFQDALDRHHLPSAGIELTSALQERL